MKYWDNLIAKSQFLEAPPKTAFAGLPHAFSNDMQFADAEKWLATLLKQKTNFSDTHPCDTDRLARVLNIPKQEVADYAKRVLESSIAVDVSAAQGYLGEHLESIIAKLDADWYEEINDYWKFSHEKHQEWKKELEELETKAKETELDPEELGLLAVRIANVRDDEEAFPYFEKAIEASPTNASLHDSFARCLLNKNDPRCVTYFENAMTLDRMTEFECARLLETYYLKNDNEEKAAECEKIYSAFLVEYIEMQRERADVQPHDEIKPHGLSESDIDRIVGQLDAYPKLKSLHMFQKQTTFFSAIPCYIIVVDSLWDAIIQDTEVQATIIETMAHTLELPGYTLIKSRIGLPGNLKAAMKNDPESKIFSRSKNK